MKSATLLRTTGNGAIVVSNRIFRHGGAATGGGGVRHSVLKLSGRAAVHGVKPPQVDLLDKEEVQTEIEKAKQEKEEQRKKIEETVDSHLKNISNNAEILTIPPHQ